MYSLKHYVKYAALWTIPAFLLWWVSLQPVLLPVLAKVENALLQSTFERARASLNSSNLQDWYIHTYLVLPENQRTSKKVQTWNVKAGNASPFTLGLPLAWLLLLASPNGRIRKTLWGTLIMVASTVVVIALKLDQLMLSILVADTPFTVYVSSGIQITHEPVAAWVPQVIDPIGTALIYFTVLGLPALLSYGFNREWWQTQYAHYQQN